MAAERRILILGAGGHAKVVVDVVETSASGTIIGILDDDPEKHGTEFFGYRVLGGRNALPALLAAGPLYGIVAIGHNRARRDLAEWFAAAGGQLLAAIHPSACVARTARIGLGTVVMAGVVINPDATIGANVIVNTGVVIEHDCTVGDHAHLAPACTLCGGVAIGEGSLVGVGASIIPGIRVGRWVTLGAGAVVISSISDDTVAFGVPATARP